MEPAHGECPLWKIAGLPLLHHPEAESVDSANKSDMVAAPCDPYTPAHKTHTQTNYIQSTYINTMLRNYKCGKVSEKMCVLLPQEHQVPSKERLTEHTRFQSALSGDTSTQRAEHIAKDLDSGLKG